MFLAMTALHALLTFGLALVFVLGHFDPEVPLKDQGARVVFAVVLGGYAGVFCLTLACFWAYQNCLVLANVTSNEHLRRKWNGSRARRSAHEKMQKPTVWARMCFFYFSEAPPSKVQAYQRMRESQGNEELVVLHEEGQRTAISNEEILKEYGIFLF